MAAYVGTIQRGQTLDATAYFDGPWKEFSRIELQRGTPLRLTADTVEYSLFVMHGDGVYQFDGKRQSLTPGAAVTVGHGAEILITSGDEPLELFITSLSVEAD